MRLQEKSRTQSPLDVDLPTRALMDTGLWVIKCGRTLAGDGHHYPPLAVDYYTLMYTVTGEGWLRAGERSYVLRAGDAILIPPHQIQEHGAHSAWDVLWVNFDGPTAQRLLAFWPDFSHEACLKVSRPEEIIRLLTCMLAEMTERGVAHALLGAGYVEHVLRLLIVDVCRSNTAAQRTHIVIQLIADYIEDHLAEQLTLTNLANHAHVSSSCLLRTFKKATGFTPIEYSIRLRLSRAAALLRFTTLPVNTIARQVGYDDAAYFTYVFRETNGHTPTAFRRQYTVAAPSPEGNGTATAAPRTHSHVSSM